MCGVDGSRGDQLAVEQSLALCEAGTSLVFVRARAEHGAGVTRQASITAERADRALQEALGSARESGIDAAGEILEGHDPRRLLLNEAAGSDLFVVASHGGSRAAGIAIGSTASAAVHRAPVPVLVARRPPAGHTFPRRVLVATDGSTDAARAVELTGRIAHRHRAEVFLLSVEPEPHGDPKRIAVDAVTLTAELQREPTVLRASGHAGEQILETAVRESISLVVVGSRGLTGVRALGSVSERVAHRARCSVLVARPA